MTPSRDQKERRSRIDPFLFCGIFSSLLALCFSSCDKPPTPNRLSDSTPKTAEQVWTEISPSLIFVVAEGFGGTKMQGSGFIVELEGKRLILTNRHVVKGAEKVMVGTDAEKLLPSASYRIAGDLDLAVIECPDSLKVPPLRLATRPLNPGAEVIALGFPLGLSKVITRGVVSAIEDKYVLFDAPISSGNSGGPVVNQFGEVIGVATMGSQSQGATVVQNLNIGIRVTAIPSLGLFADPLLRISDVAARIREVEAFIERGYRENDYSGLNDVLMWSWIKKNEMIEKVTVSGRVERAQKRRASLREKLDAQPGGMRAAVERYVSFLKQCEAKIDALPAAFGGLGDDPVLRDFLKNERQGGWVRLNATPELLPKLARISADHWLATIEDHRFRLEWALRYSIDLPLRFWSSDLPLRLVRSPLGKIDIEQAEAAMRAAPTERPSIRLPVALTGDRAVDMKSYFVTLLEWSAREDVLHDYWDSFGKDGWLKVDPVRAETLRGILLGEISDFRQHLAIIAAEEKGNLSEAITLAQADIGRRSPACGSGARVGKFLFLSGRFEEAWQAYDRHFSAPRSFDAFRLKEESRLTVGMRIAFLEVTQGYDVEALRTHGFGNQPMALRNAQKWNEQVELVEGQRLTELTSPKQVISSKWFQGLARLSRIRVLYYFRFVRQRDDAAREFERSGSLPKLDSGKNEKDFDDALDTSPDARALWDEIDSEEEIIF